MGGGTTSAGGHAVTRVQFKNGSNFFGGTTSTVAFTSNTTAGDNVISCAFWGASSTGITVTFSDSQGKTYTTDSGTLARNDAVANYTEIGVECGHSTQTSTAAADTVTCTWSSSTSFNYCVAWEVNPNGGTLSLDQANSATGTGTSISAGSITPSFASTFAIAVVNQNDGSGNGNQFTQGSSWTLEVNFGGGNADQGMEYQTAPTSGVGISGAFTSGGTTSGYAAGVANYHA